MMVPRPLGGRYAFVKRVRGTQRTIIWIARDQARNANVVCSVLPAARATGLAPAVGLTHPHSASVLEVFDAPHPDEVPEEEALAPGGRVVVAEYVDGRSLQQRVDAGPVALETAVDWVLTAADVLAKLHARGAVHGAVQPRSLVVVRAGGQPTPQLTHLLVPPSGAYCSPERVTGGGPSPADDTWALVATLYTAVARRAPFRGTSRTELARAIVLAAPDPIDGVDPVLWDIIERGLLADRPRRLDDAVALRESLELWVEETGRRSVGDFAPVPALATVSEPAPLVGDVSLIAALVRPDTEEARAPLLVERSLAEPLLSPVPPPAVAPPAADTPPIEEDPVPSRDVLIPTLSDASELYVPTAPPPSPAPAPVDGADVASAAPAPVAVTVPEGAATAPAGAARDVRAAPAPSAGRRLAGLAGLAAALAVVGLAARRATSPTSAPSGAPVTTIAATPGAATIAATPGAATIAATPGAATIAATPGAATIAATDTPAAAPANTASAAAAAGDVKACLIATLPQGTLGDDAHVDSLCTQKDAWSVTRRFDQEVARTGKGPGMVQWAHLARFDVAAVATLRGRCCPSAPPIAVATPKGLCEGVESATHAVAVAATAANVDAYAEAVGCLISRGVRYPAEWWDRVGEREARGHFEQLISTLR